MSFTRVTVGVVALVSGILMSSGAINAQRHAEPSAAARFGITLDGVQVATFTRFDSLVDASTPSAPQSISLTGGQTYSPQLWAWHEAVLMGDIVAARKSCSVIFYGDDGKPMRTYTFKQAWPVKYTGATRSDGRLLRTEGLVIVHEGFEIQ
jgi:hypothetical protein